MKRQSSRVSKYTGVGWNRSMQKWRSSVSGQGVKYDCGYFDNERDAAKARDMKILALGLKKPLQILKPAA
ncbi:AP2 domain-containing protein [Flavobacterium sp. ASV13]|uniref:AP2 domain-containing protein n=1 Tax=Flavobacterium sp. ASV13 TaxID=1506583 RepID=UPI000554791D|nr:AP2 domain-containing protein [Flavobacterium sp. ASV13]